MDSALLITALGDLLTPEASHRIPHYDISLAFLERPGMRLTGLSVPVCWWILQASGQCA